MWRRPLSYLTSFPAKIKMAGVYGLSIASNRYEDYKCSGNDAVHFKLVRNESDIDDDSKTFHPDMCHQCFGDSESIFGYKDLRVDIYCTAAKMIPYVKIHFSDKIDPDRFDGVQADNIDKALAQWLPANFLTNRDEFVARLAKDVTFKPFGDLIHSYTVCKACVERTFQIYKTDIDTIGFRTYISRLQPFLIFYIDAASYIDVDDTRWIFYQVYEKYKSGGTVMYAFVGYMTVYNYFAYPERVRPRISQVLVLPPFQRHGHGAHLIQSFYDDCCARTEVLDITVEDPSENFQRVRDFLDSRNCSRLASFEPRKLRQGFCPAMADEAQTKLKLNRKQIRRVYEILRLQATNCSNEQEVKSYRLDVKRRLNIPFQKNGRDFEKLRRALNPSELAATVENVSLEQRRELLEQQYTELFADYMHVLERLALAK